VKTTLRIRIKQKHNANPNHLIQKNNKTNMSAELSCPKKKIFQTLKQKPPKPITIIPVKSETS